MHSNWAKGEKLIISTTTCISWRHYARVQAAGSWRRHWVGLLRSRSAMPFLDKCSDPNMVYQYLSPSARYLVLRFPFFPTSFQVSLLTTLYPPFFHVHLLFPTLPSRRCVSESSSPFYRTCTFAGSPSASRETAYVTFYDRSQDRLITQLPADWPAPESSRWISLSTTLRSASTRSAPFLPLRSPRSNHRLCRWWLCLRRLSSIRLGACAQTVQQYLRLADLPRDGGT